MRHDLTSLLALGLLICCICSCESRFLNISGEFTIWLTDEYRLEKTDATRTFLVDEDGRNLSGGCVVGVCETNGLVLLKVADENGALSVAGINLSSGRFQHHIGKCFENIPDITGIEFRPVTEFAEGDQVTRVKRDVYRLRSSNGTGRRGRLLKLEN